MVVVLPKPSPPPSPSPSQVVRASRVFVLYSLSAQCFLLPLHQPYLSSSSTTTDDNPTSPLPTTLPLLSQHSLTFLFRCLQSTTHQLTILLLQQQKPTRRRRRRQQTRLRLHQQMTTTRTNFLHTFLQLSQNLYPILAKAFPALDITILPLSHPKNLLNLFPTTTTSPHPIQQPTHNNDPSDDLYYRDLRDACRTLHSSSCSLSPLLLPPTTTVQPPLLAIPNFQTIKTNHTTLHGTDLATTKLLAHYPLLQIICDPLDTVTQIIYDDNDNDHATTQNHHTSSSTHTTTTTSTRGGNNRQEEQEEQQQEKKNKNHHLDHLGALLTFVPPDNDTTKQTDHNNDTTSPLGRRPNFVIYAGTFDRLHGGHKVALSLLLLLGARRCAVGVTSDLLLTRKALKSLLQPFAFRCANVSKFCTQFILAAFPGQINKSCFAVCCQRPPPAPHVEFFELKDVVGPARHAAFDLLLVTEESRRGGDAVNLAREQAGHPRVWLGVVVMTGDKTTTRDRDTDYCCQQPIIMSTLPTQAKLSSTYLRRCDAIQILEADRFARRGTSPDHQEDQEPKDFKQLDEEQLDDGVRKSIFYQTWKALMRCFVVSLHQPLYTNQGFHMEDYFVKNTLVNAWWVWLVGSHCRGRTLRNAASHLSLWDQRWSGENEHKMGLEGVMELLGAWFIGCVPCFRMGSPWNPCPSVQMDNVRLPAQWGACQCAERDDQPTQRICERCTHIQSIAAARVFIEAMGLQWNRPSHTTRNNQPPFTNSDGTHTTTSMLNNPVTFSYDMDIWQNRLRDHQRQLYTGGCYLPPATMDPSI